ncbi:auxin-responsive protein SAUR50-like [Mangifera indica]|uniref:auxin-responsive protein SAUR50-like n=1 Tax=Mangifera indica TaxID=29780 RepID=UPI001CFA0644|nr:auxin-responsive protein SAUR50-like [Mangifera indica]
MAKRSSSSKKKSGIAKLKIVVERLNRSLSLGRKSDSYSDEVDEVNDSNNVPEDVKEGHFAVIAMKGEQPKRFVISLSYLSHPRFLKLLERAAEEYGFDHEGALTIPCRPSELEMILAERWQDQDGESSDNGDVLVELL